MGQQHAISEHDFSQAQSALAKLPILGPALWLYAKDPVRKFLFVGDTDWAVLPPVILDQCRLYTRSGIPFAFLTWAFVSDEVDARLRSGRPKIAPHEWQNGSHIWLIDIVAPFGQMEETIDELCAMMFAGQHVNAFVPQAGANPPMAIREWEVPAAPGEKPTAVNG